MALARALVLLAFLALLAAPAPASAGTLTSASLLLDVAHLPAVSFHDTAVGLGASTGSSAWTVQAGAVPTGFVSTSIPSSAAPPITGIFFSVGGNAPGSFAASAGGSMPVQALVRVTGFGGITLLPIPLDPGAPGTTTQFNLGIGITAIANAWTTRTTVIALATPTPNGATAATAMGANLLTPSAGAGQVVLVSAINVLTNISGQLPSFAVLTLNYAPEPAAAVLLAAGAAALAAGRAWGARRRR